MMTDWKTYAYKALLYGLHSTRIYKAATRAYAGMGGILTFHRVVEPRGAFSPNAALEVTPAFYDTIIAHLKAGGWRIVTMSDLCHGLRRGSPTDHLVALSFDDGYRDNFENAFAICKRHDVPMTVNVTTGFINGTNFPWWYAVEELLRHRDKVIFTRSGNLVTLPAKTLPQKMAAYRLLTAAFSHARAHDTTQLLDGLESLNSVDLRSYCRSLLMSWDMVKTLAESGLVEIGAHTVTHPVLRLLEADHAEAELGASRDVLAAVLGRPIEHVAFPYGSRQAVGRRELDLAAKLGFTSAVTTRHGTLQPEHRNHLAALPRLTVNGHYQSLKTIDVFLSGTSTALANGFHRVVTQ